LSIADTVAVAFVPGAWKGTPLTVTVSPTAYPDPLSTRVIAVIAPPADTVTFAVAPLPLPPSNLMLK
jgi:hypothetical protein